VISEPFILWISDSPKRDRIFRLTQRDKRIQIGFTVENSELFIAAISLLPVSVSKSLLDENRFQALISEAKAEALEGRAANNATLKSAASSQPDLERRAIGEGRGLRGMGGLAWIRTRALALGP
jgi:hypothetical protein